MLSRNQFATLQEKLRELGVIEVDGSHGELVDRVYDALQQRFDLENGSSIDKNLKLSAEVLDWAQALRLSSRSLTELEEKGFCSMDLLLGLRETDLPNVITLRADHISIWNKLFPIRIQPNYDGTCTFVRPAENNEHKLMSSTIKPTPPAICEKELKQKTLRETQKGYHGGELPYDESSESSDTESETDEVTQLEKTFTNLPVEARKLPRPHTYMKSKLSKTKIGRKQEATDISCNDFFVEICVQQCAWLEPWRENTQQFR